MEKVFYVVFKKNGKVIEEKAGRQYADDMTPARAALYRGQRIEGKRPSRKELRELEERQKKAEKAKWTIDRLWTSYKENRERTKGLKTDEGRFNKYLKPSFGHKEPKEILLLDIDRLKRRTLKDKAPQTVKHVLDQLKRTINYGVKRNLCQPLSFRIESPKVHNVKTEDLTPDQLKALLAAIDKAGKIQVENLMRFALFTGLRRGELFKLKWEDIDWHHGFIHIKDPKGGPNQVVPLNDDARAILENHIKTDSPYVFPGRSGEKRVDINKQASKIRDEAGLPKDFRPLHGLRHTYASMLASSGQVDMYTLQKLLTHKDPRMTQRYAHLRDDALKKASKLAAELIREALRESVNRKAANLVDEEEA
jgi:integrase